MDNFQTIKRAMNWLELVYRIGSHPAGKDEMERIIKEGYEALNRAQELYEALDPQNEK